MPRITDTYTCTVRIFHETELAILCGQGEKDDAVWVPKSTCESITKVPNSGLYELELPEYKVEEYGFD